MGQLLDQQAVVARILDHVDRKTTDLSDGMWREPVAHYRSAERFTDEIERVFRRAPTPFCPSAALPDEGSFVAREAALTPIVAVRGADGVARAFRNACRHRGMQVVDGSGCKAAFVCRYHGWTYGLDGRLRGVPHEHGFPDLDKAKNGLVPVKTVERHGMVFITQDEPELTPANIESLPDLFDARWRLVSTNEQDVAANWKIIAEGFLEGYHIRSTHQDTFYPIQYDNLNVIEAFGRNSRITFPYRRIERLRSVPRERWSSDGMLTHVYHLFPNVMVATFPTNMTMSVLEPLSVSRTRLLTFTMSASAESEEGRAAVSKGRDFVAAGAAEDREMAVAIQRGLASNANENFVFGLFEGAIAHFHRGLAAAIDNR